MLAHTYFWDTFLSTGCTGPVVKPGRCAVDTWTITSCVLHIPVNVCVCVLTDFCLFSQTLPITECPMPSRQLLQLFHSPTLSLWKKSLSLHEDKQQRWQLPQTGAEDHQNRCLCLHAGFMMSATLFGFELEIVCWFSSSGCRALCSVVREALFKQTTFPASPCLVLLSPRLPGESVLKLWQTAV